MHPVHTLIFIPLLFCAELFLSARKEVAENSPPKVEILMPADKTVVSWGTQVRYGLSVSDVEDGESKYGEINASEVLLEIEYFPAKAKDKMIEAVKEAQSRQEPKGLSLIKTSTCFGCHADKTRLAGPSFAEIAAKYAKTPAVANNLASHILNGSSGIWGALEMPAHPDLTQEQATQIATYILDQGAKRYHWVYPGLEGAFRIMEKPGEDAGGFFILTASYTDKARVRGQHTILLKTNHIN